MKVPADGTVNFNNSGYVRYYAERNGKQTEVYSFTLKMSEELPIGPLHIAAYFNDTLIPDRGTISANAGEDFCEVTFVCEEPQAELYYCFYTYEENEGAFKPVPEDGIVVFRENGTVKYFAATDEFASQSYSFNVDVTTGVGAVTVARDSEAVFYDLQGRRVSGQLLPGIYVEVKNGKAVKRIIR